MPETKKYEPLAGPSTKVKFVIAFLAILCLVLLIAVIVLAVGVRRKELRKVKTVCSSSSPSRTSQSTNDLFRDLNEEELIRVRDYVLGEASLNVTEFSKATGFDNYIYIIEMMNPDKDEAIKFLDGNSKKKPERLARVVIFAGAHTPPIVQEILVPVDNPTNHTAHYPGRKKPIPYSNRPWGSKEMDGLQKIVDDFTLAISDIMWECFEMNCSSSSCSANFPAMPILRNDRSFWVRLFRPGQGLTTVPLPLELYVVSDGSDVTLWKVGMVLYNDALFDSIESFKRKYKSGHVSKVFQKAIPAGDLHSDMHRRGNVKPDSSKVEPKIYEPDGKRYTADENYVEYMGWSFDFRVRTTSGLQLFDIRFNGTRIVYELSLQEASAMYGGFSPTSLFANYLDVGWSVGRLFELAKGVDCPDSATFFDVLAFADSDQTTKRKNGICIYEVNTGAPFRRHYEYLGAGKYFSFGGMITTALVVRTIMVPYNYDYVFDYIFYPNGVIEVKGTSMGYIISSYWNDKEGQYSTRVHKDVAGPVHDHMFNFKVDLDVAGRKNSFELIRSKVNKTTQWLSSGEYHYARYIEREQKKTEKEAAYMYDFQTPSYLNFYNEMAKNSHGVRRGYRLQLNGITRQMYPSNWSFTNALKWSFNQVAVTKYKKNEPRSSTIYNQMDFHDPVIDFSEFINDDEDITNEDLVTWVTVGLMHLPHSEDIPITTGTGTSVGFWLRPFNYFDEDPSVASRDSVVVTPSDKGSKVVRPERDDYSTCVPQDEPLSYFGNLQFCKNC